MRRKSEHSKKWFSGLARLFHCLIPALLIIPAVGYAEGSSMTLSQSPLFLGSPVKHNLMLLMDDSARMDTEILLNTPDTSGLGGGMDEESLWSEFGRLLQTSRLPFFRRWGADLENSVPYGYVFDPYVAPYSGGSRVYNGRRVNADMLVAPPSAPYAFLRTSDYNRQYYDPSVTYEVWEGYADAEWGDPLMDPNYNLTFGDAIERFSLLKIAGGILDFLLCSILPLLPRCDDSPPLTKLQIQSFPYPDYLFPITVGQDEIISNVLSGETGFLTSLGDQLSCSLGSLLTNVSEWIGGGLFSRVKYRCTAYVPATYFLPVDDGSYSATWGGSGGSCASPNPDHYDGQLNNFGNGRYTFRDGDGNQFEGALAPDGRCLRQVQITDDSYNPSVTPEGRSYINELQNFSNWFQYHRRQHHSVRHELAISAMSIDGIYADLMTVNRAGHSDGAHAGSPPAVMRDTSDAAGMSGLLQDIYHSYDGARSSYQNPMRKGLADVGAQFRRNDAGAPIQYECQQNYTLMYSDGVASDVGYGGVGNADGGAAAPFNDSYSGTLADVAYKLRTENLRPDMPSGRVAAHPGCLDASPEPWLDCSSDLHINTLAVSLGGRGNLFGETHHSVRDAFDNPPTWPAVNDASDDGRKAQVDDYYHAAVNGLGEIFADKFPADLIAEYMNRSMEQARLQQASSTSVAFNSSTVSNDSLIFSASFNVSDWSGRLVARQLNSSNGRLVQSGGSFLRDIAWNAGDRLTDDMLPADRNLITFNGTSGVEFAWSNLTEAQKSDFRAGGAADDLAQDRLDFIRGSRSLEGSLFRERSSLLGDIINSAPVLVSRPRMGWPDVAPFGNTSERYSHYKAKKVNRAPTVYVGANDGMLHAFDGTVGNSNSGKERFAYIPSFVYNASATAGLSYLSDPTYTHRSYVDLSPAVSDVYINSGSGSAWHTVLVGGLRAGGKGLFALDITSPEDIDDFHASDLPLWEFTHEKLGYLSEPVNIALVPWNGGHEWVVIVGNGYDSTTESTGLFMISLEGGTDGTWSAEDYQYVELKGAGSKGLTSDVRLVDLDGDQVVDRIYASDMDGNVWALDENNGSWRSAYKSGGTAAPLFTTKAGQPITSAPMVVRNNMTPEGEAPNLLVLFGTGRYMNRADLTNTNEQSFYAVWDNGTSGLTSSDLLERDFTERTIAQGEVRNFSEGDLEFGDGFGQHMGWYMDFDTKSGERVVQTPQVRNETIVFNTTIPVLDDPCGAAGTSYRMFIDLDGTDPDRPVLDVNQDGEVNSSDPVIGGIHYTNGILTPSAFLGNVMFDNVAGSNPALGEETNENVVDFGGLIERGRMGWRELIRR